MKNFVIGIFIMLCIQKSASSQITFAKWYTIFPVNDCRSVVQTPDNGYALFGTISANNFASEMMLLKTDDYGTQNWFQSYSDSINNYGGWIAMAGDSNFILCGTHEDTDNDSLNLKKTDLLGDVIWSRNYSDISGRAILGQIVQQTSDGGFVAVGNADATIPGHSGRNNIYMVKTKNTGDEYWDHNYVIPDPSSDDVAMIKVVSDGFVVLGRYDSSGSGIGHVYLFKTDFNGSILWEKILEPSFIATGTSFDLTDDGGFMISAIVEMPISGLHTLIIKTDGDGTEQWMKEFGVSDHRWIRSVVKTPEGDFVFAGESTMPPSPIWCLKTDASGNTLWEHTYQIKSNTFGKQIINTSDDGYAVAAYTYDDVYSPEYGLVKIGNDGVLGISDLNQNSFLVNVFPNPFSDLTSVTLPDDGRQRAIQITDLSGRIVMQMNKISESTISISAKNFPPGFYILNVYDGLQLVASKKLVVE